MHAAGWLQEDGQLRVIEGTSCHDLRSRLEFPSSMPLVRFNGNVKGISSTTASEILSFFEGAISVNPLLQPHEAALRAALAHAGSDGTPPPARRCGAF